MALARGHPSDPDALAATKRPLHSRAAFSGACGIQENNAPAYCAHPALIITRSDSRRCSQNGNKSSQNRPDKPQNSHFFVRERGKRLP